MRQLSYFLLGVTLSLTLLAFAGCAMTRTERHGRVVWCIGAASTCELVNKNLSR